VPLVAAAVCPHPPSIVPEVAVGAAPELDDLRAACDEAIDRLARSGSTLVWVVGADAATTEYWYPFRGSFAPWGVPLEVTIGSSEHPGPPLPLSLLVGAWLLKRSFHPASPVTYSMFGVDQAAPSERCAQWGGTIGSPRVPWALLVMGDGSARRGVKAPGYDEPRAEPFDATVAAALAAADVDALLALDPAEAADLQAAGRAPWQVLAGAVRATDTPWRGELLYDRAPYEVGYFVASWTAHPRGRQ
jgi:hypothetical protein